MLPPPFNTPEELRALAYRLSARARWAAELGRAQRLRGDPVAWRALINRWYPLSWGTGDTAPGRDGPDPDFATRSHDHGSEREADRGRARARRAGPGRAA